MGLYSRESLISSVTIVLTVNINGFVLGLVLGIVSSTLFFFYLVQLIPEMHRATHNYSGTPVSPNDSILNSNKHGELFVSLISFIYVDGDC